MGAKPQALPICAYVCVFISCPVSGMNARIQAMPSPFVFKFTQDKIDDTENSSFS